MSILEIPTKNLTLFLHSPQQLRAIIESEDSYAKCTARRPATGLRNFMVSGEVSPHYLVMLEQARATYPWAHGFGVFHPLDKLVIGFAGFKGAPGPDGAVEIAYGIVPAYEGKGYATEAATALTQWAWQNKRVRVVRAHTLPANNASGRVLAKCGYQMTGEIVDPEDGAVWGWEVKKA